MEAERFIGIDIGGTKCTVTSGDGYGNILTKHCFATDHVGGWQRVIAEAVQIVEKLHPEKAQAIGVSCGGPLNSHTGIISSPPNLPGWNNVPIVQTLEEKFHIPVFLQNDANACTLAEWMFGAGKGMRNMIFLTFGTGMGAGLILDNTLYTGRNGNAGEIGHIRLENFGPVGFGKVGSFEGFCSGGGIAQLGRSYAHCKLQAGETTAYCSSMGELEGITALGVAQAALAGDEAAIRVYQTAGTYLGRGLSVLMDILNPDVIILGSIYGRSGQLLQTYMEKTIYEEALHSSICPVVPAMLGENVGNLAALCVGIEGLRRQKRKDKGTLPIACSHNENLSQRII